MRAVKDGLPTPMEKLKKSEGSRSTRALEDRPGYPLKENRGLGGRAQWETISPALEDED